MVLDCMPLDFRIETTGSGRARAGRLITPHAEIETPVFMPVGTLASVKGIPQDTLEELGAQIILGNTYHLYLRPGIETVRRMGGLHGFMSWPRASSPTPAGLQVFSLNELRKVSEEGVTFRSHLDGSSHFFSPESAMEAQIGLGADIIMAFDECTDFPADRSARASMDSTARWAARSNKHFEDHKHDVPWGSKNHVATPAMGGAGERQLAEAAELRSAGQPGAAVPTQSLFGIVQGGMDRELRRSRRCAPWRSHGFPVTRLAGLA